jgi:hypothetical protein
MAKQKKKRNKQYTGVDARIERPTVTKLTAVKRNFVQQWWLEKKQFAKPVLIAAAVAIVVIWLVIELLRIAGVFGR